ncbi:MAG: DUF4252 domain-containing protein [Tannerella sp.]|jgi:hypothetical protein|nr:DUF4252 domain-containing protein [Tannerella sp.]
MEKLLVIACSIGILLTGSVHARTTDSRRFVKQYAQKEGFTVVTLNKTAIKLIISIANASDPKDDVSILSKIDNIQILIMDDPQHKKNAEVFEQEFAGFCESGGYEQFMEMENADQKNQIFCKLQGDDIIGFIIRCIQKDSAELVCINGRFGKEDLEKILSDNGKIGGGRIFGGFHE